MYKRVYVRRTSCMYSSYIRTYVCNSIRSVGGWVVLISTTYLVSAGRSPTRASSAGRVLGGEFTVVCVCGKPLNNATPLRPLCTARTVHTYVHKYVFLYMCLSCSLFLLLMCLPPAALGGRTAVTPCGTSSIEGGMVLEGDLVYGGGHSQSMRGKSPMSWLNRQQLCCRESPVMSSLGNCREL